VSYCPDCNKAPKEEDGALTCDCKGRTWQYRRSEKGTEEEEKRLAQNGFQFAESVDGDIYYLGPLNHIIHLYRDGEWDSDEAPASCGSLEEYFERLRPIRASWP
jgi:hypothetical protein